MESLCFNLCQPLYLYCQHTGSWGCLSSLKQYSRSQGDDGCPCLCGLCCIAQLCYSKSKSKLAHLPFLLLLLKKHNSCLIFISTAHIRGSRFQERRFVCLIFPLFLDPGYFMCFILCFFVFHETQIFELLEHEWVFPHHIPYLFNNVQPHCLFGCH